ncbi:hypothetical protein [Kineothrix sp. MB12-C1]|uniref:hypothetical protein n=1 Tax=Kineothrix sp. MB12-C1 TaxID=3070215 RepID=UPI0027D2E51A|nr:hypothetical protein [Kineothrix sp. MB12-C1]WMC93201.1 hypothetical protein RBB56_02645 [Kineothrix sp. MB12-C1]
MQNNETEVINQYEVRFTDGQVLSALGELEPEKRSLLMEVIKIDDIFRFCNDETRALKLLDDCNQLLDTYRKISMGIMELSKILEKSQNEDVEDIMNKMIESYSKFSREDKLEFNKRTFEKNDLTNSLDLFGYSLNKFLTGLDRTV